MFGPNSRLPAALSLAGSILGLIFASYSTLDYASHLDRRLHDVHCSFIPGMPATSEAEACRTAMYSPYAAFMREEMWGGIPISLFALGAFAFFAGFAVYLLVAAGRAPRTAVIFHAVVGVTPTLASLVMFTISAVALGSFCKTCVGMYIASFLLTAGALLGLFTLRGDKTAAVGAPDAPPAAPRRPAMSLLFPFVWLFALGVITLMPAVVYAGSVPDQKPYLTQCGEIQVPPKDSHRLVHMRTPKSTQPALFFEDPLCPTCKAFHDRLVHEGVFDNLDVQLVLFPLDSTCNWMLDRPLHPGACLVSKAVLCGGDQAKQVLEWAYEEQEYISRAGKAGEGTLRAVIKERWGPETLACVDDPKTGARLDTHLHYAADNAIPVSTPQVYLGKRRICDEDTDIGLRFTLKQLAPEVLK